MPVPRSALVTALAVAVAPAAAGASSTIALSPCQLSAPMSEHRVEARCGTLDVAEDRSRQGGRRIALRVALVKSVGEVARAGPRRVPGRRPRPGRHGGLRRPRAGVRADPAHPGRAARGPAGDRRLGQALLPRGAGARAREGSARRRSPPPGRGVCPRPLGERRPVGVRDRCVRARPRRGPGRAGLRARQPRRSVLRHARRADLPPDLPGAGPHDGARRRRAARDGGGRDVRGGRPGGARRHTPALPREPALRGALARARADGPCAACPARIAGREGEVPGSAHRHAARGDGGRGRFPEPDPRLQLRAGDGGAPAAVAGRCLARRARARSRQRWRSSPATWRPPWRAPSSSRSCAPRTCRS